MHRRELAARKAVVDGLLLHGRRVQHVFGMAVWQHEPYAVLALLPLEAQQRISPFITLTRRPPGTSAARAMTTST